ncbi:uncharacterized protein LOC114712608 [Neltuma alba]|uniref:uncharacterized protein LOC114712608 n=1 Tax=Neltuma alba TaxID=207710 RepID=UPI0010A55309|nr:uncharacterized protein LOC114712608 [Prosopis alba]
MSIWGDSSSEEEEESNDEETANICLVAQENEESETDEVNHELLLPLLEILLLDELAPSMETWTVVVKVDRVFTRTEYDVTERDLGYPKKLISLDMIVFDEQQTRMLLRIDGDELIDHFCNLIIEGQVYLIQYFSVGLGGGGIHSKHHIVVLHNILVQERNFIFPLYCFKIWFVEAIRRDSSPGCKVRDVFGLLVSIEKIKWARVRGVLTRVMTFVIRDPQGDMVRCVLFGDSADEAWKSYLPLKRMHKLVALINYAVVNRQHGKFCLKNYANATKVFWNPTFTEIMLLRRALLLGVIA